MGILFFFFFYSSLKPISFIAVHVVRDYCHNRSAENFVRFAVYEIPFGTNSCRDTRNRNTKRRETLRMVQRMFTNHRNSDESYLSAVFDTFEFL